MKTTIQSLGWTLLMSLALLTATLMATSCSSDDPEPGPTAQQKADPEVTYKGNVAYSTGVLFNQGRDLGNGAQHFHFTGNQTLERGTYLLRGWVYVDAGARLIIPAGTVIKGEKATMAALIVEPGGYVEMRGTRGEPIVMTSAQAPGMRRPGDWGGLIICGRARNNQQTMQIEGGPTTQHGGTDDQDNSGIFQYVRVEFAGYPFDTDKEINGITFGSVGAGTTVDHLQVSYSNDDSFEWFGGTVNCKYLVAYKGWDDEFDTDNGYSGTVQYGLSIRDPRIADTSQSNGFESDNNASGAETAPFTSALLRNITLIGPMTELCADFQNTPDFITAGPLFPGNGSKLGRFQAAMQLRRGSRLRCQDVVAVGYPIGLLLDGEKGNTVQLAKAGELTLKDILFAGMGALGSDKNKEYTDYLYDYQTKTEDRAQQSYSHTFFLQQPGCRTASEQELGLTDPRGTGQNYCPATSLSNGKGGYLGALRDAQDDWLDGWTNFDPQNTVY